MEEKLSTDDLSAASSLELPEKEENAENSDPFAPTYPVWSSRARCLQAYACVVLGFSSVHNFVYSLGEFGAVIFIPFIAFKFLVVLPVAFAEIMLGRFIGGNTVKAFEMTPNGLGVLAGMFCATCVASLSNFVLQTYNLKYLTSLFSGNVQWASCSTHWAGENCYTGNDNMSAFINCVQRRSFEYCSNLTWESSARQFWKNVVVNTKTTESIAYSCLYLSIEILAALVINYNGIKSLEKVLFIFVYGSLILASVTAINAFLVPGVLRGFLRIWYIDLKKIFRPIVWVRGLEDSLLTLNVGFLTLPFISSHGNFRDDFVYDLLTVFFTDILACVIVGIPMLCIIESFNSEPFFSEKIPGLLTFGPPIRVRRSSGDGSRFRPLHRQSSVSVFEFLDVYVTMSEALLYFPEPIILWAFVFYLEIFLLEFGSQIIMYASICEVLCNIFINYLQTSNLLYYSLMYASIAVGLCSFFIFFPEALNYPVSVIVLVVVFLLLITVQICYGQGRLGDDFQFMMGYHIPVIAGIGVIESLFFFCAIIIELYLSTTENPVNYGICAYMGLPFAVYLIVMITQIIRAFRKKEVLKAFTADPNWGSNIPILRKSRRIFDSKAITKEFMYRQELNKKPLMKANDFTDQNIVLLT